MQIGNGDVVAPYNDQIRMPHLLRRHSGHGSIKARIGGPAHETTEFATREQGCTKLVKEPAVHRTIHEFTMWTRVVERHNRLCAVLPDRGSEPCMHEIERIIPGDTLELIAAARPNPF